MSGSVSVPTKCECVKKCINNVSEVNVFVYYLVITIHLVAIFIVNSIFSVTFLTLLLGDDDKVLDVSQAHSVAHT